MIVHTFGAIILAAIGTSLMRVILAYASDWLVEVMYKSTGVLLLPLVVSAALAGCAYYAGVYFGLKLVPKASSRITMWVMMLIVVVGTIGAFYQSKGMPSWYPWLLALNFVAAIIGCFIGRVSAEADRLREGE